jgi:type III secretory pathway component EscS
MTGCLAASFFLSRTYVVFLYLLIGVIVGLYQSARRHHEALPALSLRTVAKKLVVVEIVAVVALWLITRILLAFN